jgi:multicomponent Na+:H+ antiporter subunit B
MLRLTDSIVIEGITRLMIPVIQLFACYVIFHGHYSPGGGFQGGALLASSFILERLVLGEQSAWKLFPKKLGLLCGLIGLLLYAGVGSISLFFDKDFLDYAGLPFTSSLSAAAIRSWGILFIEIGVATAVTGTLVLIFDQLLEDLEP